MYSYCIDDGVTEVCGVNFKVEVVLSKISLINLYQYNVKNMGIITNLIIHNNLVFISNNK